MKKILITILSFFASFSMAAQNINNIKLRDSKSGQIKTIKSFKGKTYIKLWASWCPVCLATLSHVDELAKQENLDFNVITIVSPNFLGELNLNDFKKWWGGLPEYNKLTVLLDEKASIAKIANVRAYPTNLFLNSKGEIKKIQIGALDNKTIKNIMKNIE